MESPEMHVDQLNNLSNYLKIASSERKAVDYSLKILNLLKECVNPLGGYAIPLKGFIILCKGYTFRYNELIILCKGFTFLYEE